MLILLFDLLSIFLISFCRHHSPAVTDGGRIAQAIFNRAGKQIVGQLFLFALFAVGILGDDLFLFYAFFCLLFQQGSEIPQRNEVDDISFSRVLLATAAGVVALLSIIPMQ
jgi:hypothetical protein